MNFEMESKTMVNKICGHMNDASYYRIIINDCRYMLASNLINAIFKFIWIQVIQILVWVTHRHVSFQLFINNPTCMHYFYHYEWNALNLVR